MRGQAPNEGSIGNLEAAGFGGQAHVPHWVRAHAPIERVDHDFGAMEELLPSYIAGGCLDQPRSPAWPDLPLHTLTVTLVPAWLQLLEQEMPDIRISLIPDRGGIEANLATLVDGEADFFLTYAHARVPFHLDRERFDYLSVGSDRLVPVVAPQVRLPRDRWVPGAGLLDRAVSEGVPVPYLSYGFSSFFGAALGRLFAERPQFLRRHVHENAIGAGLKTLALTGADLCWLPQSLIQAELNAGLLVNASTTTDWTMDLEIHLYRHLGSQSKLVKNFWRSAEALLRTQVPLPVRQRMI